MPDRVHHHPNLIYSLGTQVVTWSKSSARAARFYIPAAPLAWSFAPRRTWSIPIACDLPMGLKSR